MTHAASNPALTVVAQPWLRPLSPEQTGAHAPLNGPLGAAQPAPQQVLAGHMALANAGSGMVAGLYAPSLPPLLAAPSPTAQALTAELGSAGWQAYLRGMVRDLAYKTSSISEEQLTATAAINGARSSGHSAAHLQHVQALNEANQLEADAKAANAAAAKKAQEAAAARGDAQSKAGAAERAGKDLAESQKAKSETQGKIGQVQRELNTSKLAEERVQNQLTQIQSQIRPAELVLTDLAALQRATAELSKRVDLFGQGWISWNPDFRIATKRDLRVAEKELRVAMERLRPLAASSSNIASAIQESSRFLDQERDWAKRFEGRATEPRWGRPGITAHDSFVDFNTTLAGGSVIEGPAVVVKTQEAANRDGIRDLGRLLGTLDLSRFTALTTASISEFTATNTALQRTLAEARAGLDRASGTRRDAESKLATYSGLLQVADGRISTSTQAKSLADDAYAKGNVAALKIEADSKAAAARAADMAQVAAVKQLAVTKQALDALGVSNIGGSRERAYAATRSTVSTVDGDVAEDLVQRAQEAYQDAVLHAKRATQESLAANNARLDAAQALARVQAEMAFEGTNSAVGSVDAAASTLVNRVASTKSADDKLSQAIVELEQARSALNVATSVSANAAGKIAALENRIQAGERAQVTATAQVAETAKLNAFADALSGTSTPADAFAKIAASPAEADALLAAFNQIGALQEQLNSVTSESVKTYWELYDKTSEHGGGFMQWWTERSSASERGLLSAGFTSARKDARDAWSVEREGVARKQFELQNSTRAGKIAGLDKDIQAARDVFMSRLAGMSESGTAITDVSQGTKDQIVLLVDAFNKIGVEQSQLDKVRAQRPPDYQEILRDTENHKGGFDHYWSQNSSAWKRGAGEFFTSFFAKRSFKEDARARWNHERKEIAGQRFDELKTVQAFTVKGHESRVEAVRADLTDRIAAIKNDHATAVLALGKAADEMVSLKQVKLDLATERSTLADAKVVLKNAELVHATKAEAAAVAREHTVQARVAEAAALVVQREALVRLSDAQTAELSALAQVATGHRERIEVRLDALLNSQVDATVAVEAAELATTRAALAVAQAEQRAAAADAARTVAESQAADKAATAAAAAQSAKEMALEFAQTMSDSAKRSVGKAQADQPAIGTDAEAQALVQSATDALVAAKRDREAADQLAESARMAKDAASARVADATTVVHDRLLAVAQASRNLAVAAGSGDLADVATAFEGAIHDELGAFAKLINAQTEGAAASIAAKAARDALAQARAELADASAQRVASGQLVSTAKTELRDAIGEAKAAREAMEQATVERDAAVLVAEQLKVAIKTAIAEAELATERARAQRELATRLVDEVAEAADKYKDLLSRHGVQLTELLQFIEELLALDTSGLLEQARAALARSRAEAKQATLEREVVKVNKANEAEVKRVVLDEEALASAGQGSVQAVLNTMNMAHTDGASVGGNMAQASGASFFKQLQQVAQQIEAMNDEHFRRIAQPLKV